MTEQRNQRQDQVNYTPPAGPALFKAALRGAIITGKAVFDAEILVRQAKDAKQRQIAEVNHRNALQENRDAMIAVQYAQQALAERKQDHTETMDAQKAEMTAEQMEEGFKIVEEMYDDGDIDDKQYPLWRQAVREGKLVSMGIDLQTIQAKEEKEKTDRQELEGKIDALPDDQFPPIVKQLMKIDPEGNRAFIASYSQSVMEDKQEEDKYNAVKTAIFGEEEIPKDLKSLFWLKSRYGVDTGALITHALKEKSGETTTPPDLSKLPDAERNLLLQATYRLEPKKAASAQNAYLQFDLPNRKAQLLNLATDELGEDADKQVKGRWAMLYATQDMVDSLSELKAEGVSLGLLAGTWEQINQRFGRQTSDPRLSEFQNKMLATIQMYRQAMSGAAFTESESKEYNRLFPGIATSWDLNTSRLKGINDAIKIRLRSDYNILLGPNAPFVYDGVTGIHLNEPLRLPANLAQGQATTRDLTPQKVVTQTGTVNRPEDASESDGDGEIPEEHKQVFIESLVELVESKNLSEEQIKEHLPAYLRSTQNVTDQDLIDELVKAVIKQTTKGGDTQDATNEPPAPDNEQ